MSTEASNQVVPHQNTAAQVVEKKKKKKKPAARVQVDASVLDEDDKPQQSGSVFNIWFYNWGAKDKYQKKSSFRVNVKRDSGYTRANKVAGSFICLFFARGCCHKGKDCDYLHRLPKLEKDAFPMTTDCFGRDKFSDYREDMGGVGNFLRPNRTLYIGKLLIESVPNNTTIEELLSANFKEFGTVERIRVIHEKSCAFITFENEWNAQFAKEAMAHQSIVKDEVLNIRWANEDPNPAAKARNQRQLQRDAVNTIKQLLDNQDERASYNSNGINNKTIESGNIKAIENTNVKSIAADNTRTANQVDANKKRALTVSEPSESLAKKLKSAAQKKDNGLITGYASSSSDDDNDDDE